MLYLDTFYSTPFIAVVPLLVVPCSGKRGYYLNPVVEENGKYENCVVTH